MSRSFTPLTSISLTCPGCKNNSEISFYQEVSTLPILKVKIPRRIMGKCDSCGHAFEQKNKNKIYKYMDLKGISYKRSSPARNLLFLIIPILIIMVSVYAIASFAQIAPGTGYQQTGENQANGLNVSVSPTLNAPVVNASVPALNDSRSPTGTAIVQTAVSGPGAPIEVYGVDHYDPKDGKYYLPITLTAGSSPVDLKTLTVTVRLNNKTITPNAWEYDNDSCQWAVQNTNDSVLYPHEVATIVVDMSYYDFNNGSVVYLDFKIPGKPTLTGNYTVMKTTIEPTMPIPAIIYNGSYDFISGKTINYNDPNIVKVSGQVYVNNWPKSDIAVSFSDGSATTTVTSVENGFYIVDLEQNKTYTVKAWSTTYGPLLANDTPRVFRHDSTLDIKLSTPPVKK